MLQIGQFLQAGCITVVFKTYRCLVVGRNQLADAWQSTGNDVEYRRIRVERDVLCQVCDTHARTQPDAAVIGTEFSVDHAHQ